MIIHVSVNIITIVNLWDSFCICHLSCAIYIKSLNSFIGQELGLGAKWGKDRKDFEVAVSCIGA